MAEFVGMFIDETGEQCDQLVEALLALESDPHDGRRLAESFRLIHSIKGSAALLGFDKITGVAHHLESHFERLRSGALTLDRPMIELALRCVDYFRDCNERLRTGSPLAAASDLLELVKQMEHSSQAAAKRPPASAPAAPPSPAPPAAPAAASPSVPRPALPAAAPSAPPSAAPSAPAPPPAAASQPVAAAAHPPRDADTARPPAEAAPDARSRRIRLHFAPGLAMADIKAELVLTRLAALGTVIETIPPASEFAAQAELRSLEVVLRTAAAGGAIAIAADVDGVARVELDVPPPERPAAAVAAATSETTAAIETMRVDVERLDVLMNLVGELVVTRARFVQLATDLAPLFRKTAAARSGGVHQPFREALDAIIKASPAVDERAVAACEFHMERIENQGHAWDEGQRRYAELVESVDHLTRVADNLQRGVLGTRMVPVGPLLSRFKRSVRDIAGELGKSVVLELAGEKTELDKRMIDELGDPLVHLVRNAIDHGIEPADVRLRKGKPETATLRLAAAHRGNNVLISISDDGGGIDVDRIRDRAVSRGLVSAEQAATLGSQELIDFIWQPGFSTAREVSNISGRGVGMDIVRTRIESLSGSVDVESTPGQGTTFLIRLPLTLAIARCMLFRMRQAVFAVPVENVREIITVAEGRILSVGGRRVCDIRGEFLPLFDMDQIFKWNGESPGETEHGAVLVLHAGLRSVAVSVGSLLGTQDLVVKSLDDNFMRIRGIGGASILGDGEVCLLLDVSAAIDLVMRPRGGRRATDDE
jgi:two-component system chemotaxis sensor kinase CheA